MATKDYIKEEPLYKMFVEQHPGKDSRFALIGFYFGFLHKSFNAHMQQMTPDIDLNPGEMPFITVLRHKPGLSQHELSEILHVDKALTARVINALLRKGYIKKESDNKDKRRVRIFLTKKVNTTKEKCAQAHRKWTKILTEDVSEDELSTLKSILRKFCNNIIQSQKSKKKGMELYK
ncbi:MAG: MarR family transcriptional regulator [bacterium]|nr:MarR family transcriptional regulator [bacterium]